MQVVLDSALLAHSALAILPVPLLASLDPGSGAPASSLHSASPPPAPNAASLSPQREKRAA